MLTLKVPGREFYDENKNEFVYTEACVLELEHSLISLSKWESKWNVPFLGKANKTDEQTLDYIKHMSISRNVNPEVYLGLSNENIEAVNAYISQPMTATTFRDEGKGRSTEVITAEIIYHWMIAHSIPFECQKWHLNRLLTLIRVCNIKNAPAKKMSRRELMNRNRALNESRRQSLNTTG